MDIGEQFILKFDADDSGIQSVLTNIINQAKSGITVGIAMDADTTKVIQKIEQISDLMQQKIGAGTFDFNDLFNFKNAVAELGTLASKFDQLAPIFNSYNDMANSLTASMTKIASLKLDASQFDALKTSLESIDTSLRNIGEKLGVVSSGSGMKKVAQDAKEATAEMEKAAAATDKLGQEQKELGTTPIKSTPGVDATNTQNAFGVSEDSLRTMMDLFQKIEASVSAMKAVFVDVGDGQEFSPLLGMIDKIDISIKELSASMAGMKLNLNMNLGSEVNERTAQKTTQAMTRQLEAYKKLFAAMKSTGKTNKEMLFFTLPDEADIAEAIGKYKGVINRAEKQFGKDTYKNLIGSDYANYIKEINNATDQFNRATKTKGVENPLGDLFGKTDLTEVISQLGLIATKLDEIAANAVEFKNAFKEGFSVNSQLEEINKLTVKIKELEGELANVRSGGVPTKTATNGEQLALESTLQKTHELQDIMATTLLSVDESITKISNTASTKLIPVLDAINEKIKVNSANAVVSAKTQQQAIRDTVNELDNANAKAKKSTSSDTDLGAVTKQSYAELTKLTKQIYSEKQAIAKLDAKNNAEEIAARQAIIASRQAEIDIIREGQHYYGLTQGQEEANYRQLRANLEQQLALTKGKTSDKAAQTQEKQYVTQLNADYAEYVKRLKEAQTLRAKRDEMRPLASDEDMARIAEKIVIAEEKLTAAWRVVRDEFAKDPFAQAHISTKLLQSELEAASISAEKLTGQAIIKKYQDARKIVGSGLNSMGFINTDEAKQVEALILKVRKLDAMIDKAGANGIAENENSQKQIFETIKALEQLKRNVNVYEAFKAGAYNTYNKGGDNAGTYIPGSDAVRAKAEQGIISYEEALRSLVPQVIKAKNVTLAYDENKRQLMATYKDEARNTEQATLSLEQYGNGVRVVSRQTQQHVSLATKIWDSFGKKVKELLRYFSAFTILMRVINAVKQGVQTVKEMNTALTEMKLVTESTAAEMAKIEKQIQQVAETVASTNVDIAKSATDWAKLGYAMSDALELAAVSAQYAKVGFTDVETATENLTATLQAFYSDELRQGLLDAGELAESMTDKFVDVGNKFASSAEGLGQGMTEASAALVAAGNDVDEAIAMITAGKVCLNYMETCYYRTHLIALIA